MKNLAVVTLLFTFSSTTYAAFDCTTLQNKEEMMACLKDLRQLENKYSKKDDACSGINQKKSPDEYKLCVATEKKKDPCYVYKKYGTQEGSSYEKCYIDKSAAGDKSISDSKREAKPIEQQYDSMPAKIKRETSSK